MNEKEYIVISLGGSLIVPDEIDVDFLKSFTENIKNYTNKGFNFVIITGGGSTARTYIDALKKITNPNNIDLDWIGIATTRVNAELLRVSFGDIAHSFIVMDPDSILKTDKSIIIGGGWKPGNSSDLAAVHAACSVGAKKVINLSNIDYVYNKDPKKFPDAEIIKKSTWPDFRAILPKEWNPGLNSPFDPIAAQKAESLGLEVVIMNGKNIENLNNYLNGEDFMGTVIR
ncbi:MAG: UMP kinase [Patescibacteria group bacterium]|nr:UMP kinase [Patescibacteria group bacterium]